MWSAIAVSALLGANVLELSTVGDAAFEEGKAALPALVWRQSPDLHEARVRVAQAEAARRKALRLPNPGLDVAINTLPVGPLNPADLKEPLLNVPNVQVGLSLLLELGKRGPRQDATAESARAAALEALDLLRLKVLELDDVIGDVSAAQVRVETLEGLSADARRLSELQQARAQKGDASDLDADRARLEEEGTMTSLSEAREQVTAALRQCAQLVAMPCGPFSDPGQASAWLGHRPARSSSLERRPDLRALEAARNAAKAAQTLAERGWVPDPTVRVGYVRDQFVVSGNQQNSVFVGFSVPLRVFEHDQDDAEAAAVAARSAEQARTQLLATALAQQTQLEREVASVSARQRRLRDQSLPLARSIVERLATAVSRGAAPLQELLLARRTLVELLLTGTELDRTLFHLHVAGARLTSSLDELPAP